MSEEQYIPITLATRIPFPCKLKHSCGDEIFCEKSDDYTAAELIGLGWTHYCTSATEPTGRPGKEYEQTTTDCTLDELIAQLGNNHLAAIQINALREMVAHKFTGNALVSANESLRLELAANQRNRVNDNKYLLGEIERLKASHSAVPTNMPREEDRWASAEQEHESLKAIVDQERNPKAVRPLGPDEAWPNSPAVPPASGATGEVLLQEAQMVIKKASSDLHFLYAVAEPIAKRMEIEFSLDEIALKIRRHFASAPASRPAVAQEGVRDTERLTGENETLKDTLQGVAVMATRLYRILEKRSPNEPIVAQAKEYLKRMGVPYTSTWRSAMSSQPEGRG